MDALVEFATGTFVGGFLTLVLAAIVGLILNAIVEGQ